MVGADRSKTYKYFIFWNICRLNEKSYNLNFSILHAKLENSRSTIKPLEMHINDTKSYSLYIK